MFVEWKTMVEKATGKSVKTLRSDNRGDYIVNDIEKYLKFNGKRHQSTVRKTPEQNGVAERFLIEENKGDPKRMWQVIKKVLDKATPSTEISSLEVEGKTIQKRKILLKHFIITLPT